jgi:hypothetical protein
VSVAVRCSCLRAADCSQCRPEVGPWITHNNAPARSPVRNSSHGSSPPPPIHADLAAAPALSTPNKNGPARLVKVGLGEGERFADPQSATPKDHDQRPESSTVRTFAGCSHHSHDLIDCWSVGRLAQALVTRRAPLVVARHRGRRPAMASRVVRDRFHRALLLER